jgi:formiminotetrahydrofolate cyclodeaminase
VTGRQRARSAEGLESLSLTGLLDALEAPAPSPSGGSAAAIAGAMAASLVTLVARRSPGWRDADGVAAQAVMLRERLVDLAAEDARAFAAAMEALSAARGTEGGRDHLLGVALERAADVPLLIASACADLAELAALAAFEGAPTLQPDATAAAVLAEAAAVSCAHLVRVNLATLPDDTRVLEAEASADVAALARARALGERT